MYRSRVATLSGIISGGTPSSSAAIAISATYASASASVSGVPNRALAARPESTSAACTHSSSAGSPAAYGWPVTVSTPRTRVWMARTRCATRLALSLSPNVTVTS